MLLSDVGKPERLPSPRATLSMTLSPKEAYFSYASKGAAIAAMPTIKALHTSIHAGMLVGFGGLLAITIAAGPPGLDAICRRFIFAAVFPFIMFIILTAGGQLYTGNTGSVTAAVLEGYTLPRHLWRALAIALVGNVIGCVGFAFVAQAAGIIPSFAGELAATYAIKKLTTVALGTVFLRAIICNWLVCLAILLAGAAPDVTGKLLMSYLPIFAFIVFGLEHSVANAFMLPLGLLGGASITFTQMFLRNLLPVALGNFVGGAVLIAASYSFQYGKLGECRLGQCQLF